MTKKPDRPLQRKSALLCGLLGLTPRGLEGWATGAGRPKAPVTIEVKHEGVVLGTFPANRHDVAIPSHFHIPPGHGFAVQVDVPAASLKLPATIEVKVANSPQIVGSVRVDNPTQLAWLVTEYIVGHVDAVRAGCLVGWAVDMKQPGKPLKVELLVSGQRAGSTTCSIIRPDVRRTGIGTGLCGFSLQLPDVLLDGRLHEIKARVQGSSVELGPVLFGPASYSELGQQVAQLQANIAEIEKQLAMLSGPGGILYRQIEDSLLRRHEALMEIHRESVEGELAELRKSIGNSRAVGQPGVGKKPAAARRRQ